MSKENARKYAEGLSFDNSDKKESQDICFVPDGDYFKFIESYTGEKFKKVILKIKTEAF